MLFTINGIGYRFKFSFGAMEALNNPSRKAAKRLGLSYEGMFRQATIYAATSLEWPSLKEHTMLGVILMML